jgi:(2Fe-2S) ferredoxin
MSKNTPISEFHLEGRFLSFILEDGYKIKWLRLATSEGEISIKLSKQARASLGKTLIPGDWIAVSGEQTRDRKTDDIKLKAHLIRMTSPRTSENPTPLPALSHPKTTILVCQKSDCMKRGGHAVWAALQQGLRDRGVDEQVTLRGTGCMKNCKAGPNLVVMPNKTRYSQVNAAEAIAVINHHVLDPSVQES